MIAKIPYNSVATANRCHKFRFWSLDTCLTIESPFSFQANDVVEILKVDTETNTIYVCPNSEARTNLSLLIVSNDIPVDSDTKFNFSFINCELLHSFEATKSNNRIYTFAVLAPSEVQSKVVAKSYQNKFTILISPE